MIIVHSLRTRLTLIGGAVLLVGLALGGIAFDRLLEQRLTDNLDQTLLAQAADRARTADAGADTATLVATIRGETAIAIFDEDGSLLDSRNLDDPRQVADAAPGDAYTGVVDLQEDDEVERYSLRIAAAQPGATRVVVASELHPIDDPLSDVRRLLLIGIPLVALVGGGLIWVLTGRVLRPVEAMRRDAQTIADGGDTSARVRQSSQTDEIGRLAATLNDMLERLAERTDVLRRFVSDASHEIRSPVANIRARVETTDSEPSADEWSSTRADVVSEVERVEAIVDDLTFLAKSDEGRLGLTVERVELDDLLFGEAARLQRRGRVTVDAAGVEPLMVEGDRPQLARAIRNLVDNAERHAGSAVQLSATADHAGVTVTVDDDGPGVPAVDRAIVFERFARLDDSRGRATGGTGLGLAIVSDIVDRHGGSVTIDDAPLGGARARITLPRQP
ncbi:MAG: HAMP domain-containing sensor histidine kinase [Acidimicrobiia bacterium]|nr:HAMP domain-containing sensor histidine kinase [Acidimicrobiia bacterium]